MKILSLNTRESDGGIPFYRVSQPLDYLKSKGHEVIQYEKNMDLGTIAKDIDILHMASLGSPEILEQIASLIKTNIAEQMLMESGVSKDEMEKAGLSTRRLNLWIDFDDDIFTCNPHNVAYVYGGRKEVVYEGGYLWKHGDVYNDFKNRKVKFDIKRNAESIKAKLELIRLADIFTSPSKFLLKKYKRFVNGKAYLLPNAIDTDKYRHKGTFTDETRLLWTLSHSHYEDWCDLYPVIGEVMKMYPKLTLVTVGEQFATTGRVMPLSQREHHAWKPVAEYMSFLNSLRCNVGIAHVTDNKFNLCKSPLKWEEYTALGLDTLCSANLYKMYLGEGENVYYNKGEFKAKLINICENGYKQNLKDLNLLKDYDVKMIGDNLEKELLKCVNG